jgi:GPH family glycoside/pentoside/hexuronide:cation symporter
MHPKPTSDESLPASVKIAFGAPAFAGAAMGISIGVLMPRFYSDVVLAPMGIIAVAIAAARAFDALTDPVMGWISDRTHSRWGRRKIFMAAAGPFAALIFFAIFAPPASLTPKEASVWFASCFTLFFLFTTVVQIPYAALGAELTSNYGERSSLFGYRSMFIAAGMIGGALLPVLLVRQFGLEDERIVHRTVAAMYAALFVVLGAVMLVRVPEREEFARRESNPLVPGVRRALRNRPFRILFFAGIVSAIPAAIPAMLMPYFVGYVLQPGNPGLWTGVFLGVYLGTGFLFIPLWIVVARRIGKLGALLCASTVGISGSVFYFFAGPGDLLFAGCIYFVTGTQAMAGTFLVPAMVADVIDYDELRTGKRREGQYAAFLALIPKFVAIPGSSVPLAILAAVGYVPNQVQSEEVLFWIRFLYSLFPASFYVLSLLIVSRYPISESVHGEIRDGIAARESGEVVVDPLTGARLVPHGTGGVSEIDGWFLDHFTFAELKRALGKGRARLVVRVVAAMGLSLLLSAAATLVAVNELTSPERPPALITVIAVVVAGLALTAFLFHLLRLRPAWRMVAAPLPVDVVRAHLQQGTELS